jgi:hypothetical protein
MTLRTFTDSDRVPDKIVMYATKGWGKTTLGALAPKPIFLLARGELGYLTLRRNGLVPDCPFAVVEEWEQLEGELREMIVKGVNGAQTLVLDCLGGFERLCFEKVCREKYKNDWGESGFAGYGRGVRTALPEWIKMLTLLDEVNAKLKVRVLMLAHSKVKTFANPISKDFDRYMAECEEKTWEPINGWADAVFFGRHRTVVKDDGKAVGGDERVLHTVCSDAFEAKNRHGLPALITMPKEPWKMWDALGPKLEHAALEQAAKAPASPTAPAPTTVPTAAPDPNAERKTWADNQAAKATPEGRTAEKNGATYDALRMEFDMLIAKHKLQDRMEKWIAHYKLKSAAEFTDVQIKAIIEKIRANYEAQKPVAT